MNQNLPILSTRKYGTNLVNVVQLVGTFERSYAYKKKTAAFEEWRGKLNKGDRVPRGRFFRGKRPGRKLICIDEAWRAMHHIKIGDYLSVEGKSVSIR